MVQKTMSPIELAERLALVLALAFFLGLAFEETYKRDEPTIPGGIRTFPLVGMTGAMLYLVEPHWVLAFGAGPLAIGAWLYAFLQHEQSRETGSGRTLIVPVSNLLVYALGPIALTQPPWVAVGVTVAAVLVIGTRERMHGFVRLIPQDEVLTAGKFLVLVGIILPLVPDTQLMAISPVTPYHIWLAVVAISSLSYLTYLVQRYRPVKGGAFLSALLGGAYSSTATTVVLAKRQKETITRRPELSAGIIAATAVMYPRLEAVIAFFSPPIAAVLLPGLGFLFIVAAAISWWEWRNIQPSYADDLAIPAANPLQLTSLTDCRYGLGRSAPRLRIPPRCLAVAAMQRRCQELSMPVVIIAGTDDRIVDHRRHSVRVHQEIPQSALRLVPGVGHMLHYAVPEQIVDELEATVLRSTPAVSSTA